MFAIYGLTRPAGGVSGGTAARVVAVVGMGWDFLGLEKNTAPSSNVCNLAVRPQEVQSRWRGAAAQGAGTGFRNRHWTSAYAASKHIPISFKDNPAVAGGVTYPELEGGTRGLMRGVLTGA